MAEIKPNLNVQYSDKATIITFSDSKILEEKDIKLLQDSLMAIIAETRGINLVLDFQNVEFLSSAILGLLIRISKKIYEQDGQLKLCNIKPKILEIFKITRLTKVFDINDDLDSALEDIQ